jgi:glycerol-3-phosphate cytidylyltransferase
MGERIGFINGTFDLLHYGHIITLKECKDKCEHLIVAVQIDPCLESPDVAKPIQSITERLGQVWSLKFVDRTITYRTEDDLLQLLKSLKPDKRFVSDEYRDKEFTGDDSVNIYFYAKNNKYTSSELKQRIIDAAK